MDKTPEIYKNKINKLRTEVQDSYYYSKDKNNIEKEKKINSVDVVKKIESIFKKNDYVYKASINIMYKNGESSKKNIIGIKDKYLLTMEGERISIDDIYDIK